MFPGYWSTTTKHAWGGIDTQEKEQVCEDAGQHSRVCAYAGDYVTLASGTLVFPEVPGASGRKPDYRVGTLVHGRACVSNICVGACDS